LHSYTYKGIQIDQRFYQLVKSDVGHLCCYFSVNVLDLETGENSAQILVSPSLENYEHVVCILLIYKIGEVEWSYFW
jgi:hypothetical protein